MKRLIALGIGILFFGTAFAWNAMGHELVAQIAYDNLTPKTKRICNRYNHSMNKVYPSGNFVHASIWLDSLRVKEIHWFDSLHYIDIPFTNDDSQLPPVPEPNVLWGIEHSISLLQSNKPTEADKGLGLRILMHIVGDVHQPLHTTALITQSQPHGDLGGNLFPLGPNPIGSNLHSYWDNGGGILIGDSADFQLRNKAKQLESHTPCSSVNTQSSPQQWINASHELAKNQVYTLERGSVPSKQYQLNTQNITQRQIVLAGCRLAALLNKIYDPK